MIKILSGWSNPGGSTVALINLCNLLKSRGHECVFYGPHSWHIGQCNSAMLEECVINKKGERLIINYFKLPQRPPKSEVVVLGCHETDIFPVKDIPCFWDVIVYVSESQREWQGVYGKVIPNVVADLSQSKATVPGSAGIIGSIDRNKNTHVSIERARTDGYKAIKLYGLVTDQNYYEEKVKKFIDSGLAVLMGHEDNKQKMYDSLSAVYQSSKRETFNFVKAECEKTGTLYRGLESAESGAEYWSETNILKAWEEALYLS